MIWVILIMSFLLRSISLNQSLWLDEAINVLATQQFSLLGIITEYARSDFHPPLYFVILWIWSRIFGIGEIVVRIPSLFFGIATIYTTYLLGKKIYSKKLGLIAALFLAVNPLHIYYSQEARMYSLAAFAVTLNMLIFTKMVKNEKVNTVFLVLSNFLVFTSDYLAYFIFPAQLLIIFLTKQKSIAKKWLFGLMIVSIFWVVWIPEFLNQLKAGSQTALDIPSWRSVVGGFDIKALPLTFVKFIIGRISLTNKLIYLLILLPIGSLFSFVLYRAIRNNSVSKNSLISWLVVPNILALAVSTLIPIYSYFRLLFTLPAFVILVSLGIISFKSKLKYIFLILLLSIQLISSFLYLLNPQFQREDWRGLVDFLKTKEDKVILFESSGNLSPFEYYSKNELSAFGALKKFPAENINDLVDLINIKQHNIYLVDYLVDLGDPKRLVKMKLESLGFKQMETRDFHGLGFLFHYAK